MEGPGITGVYRRLQQRLQGAFESEERIENTCRQFQPAVLEATETPASPASRLILKAVIALLVITLVWASVGKVDIVVEARGKIVPGGGVKTIQSSILGEVGAIHVKEGQSVKAGDVLLSLVSDTALADLTRLEQQHAVKSLQLQREQRFSGWLETAGCYQEADKDCQETAFPAGLQSMERTDSVGNPLIEEHRQFEQQMLVSQALDFQAAYRTLSDQQRGKQAEQRSVQARVNKLAKTEPLVAEQLQAVERLNEQKFASRVDYLKLQQQHIEISEEQAALTSVVNQLQAEQQALRQEQVALQARALKASLDRQAQLRQERMTLAQELIKGREAHRQTELRSPIDGTVQGLQVRTLGGVVQPAQPVMTVVPARAEMEAEVWVLNPDIGFVSEGQPVEIKVDAYRFTRYGLLPGTIKHLSKDAVEDEQGGLRYLASIELEETTLSVDGREESVGSGMAVTADIKTGQRRIIEYFLSPLSRLQHESIRER